MRIKFWKLCDFLKWLFKIKNDDVVKARLVVKGCSQKAGIDNFETNAPVARLTSLKILLAIICQENLYTYQLDIKNAFLQGKLQDEVYIKIPKGFINVGKTALLLKSIYGLK